jgi:hypothetical protein
MTDKRIKRKIMGWKKIFVQHRSEKGIAPGIHKELPALPIRKKPWARKQGRQ